MGTRSSLPCCSRLLHTQHRSRKDEDGHRIVPKFASSGLTPPLKHPDRPSRRLTAEPHSSSWRDPKKNAPFHCPHPHQLSLRKHHLRWPQRCDRGGTSRSCSTACWSRRAPSPANPSFLTLGWDPALSAAAKPRLAVFHRSGAAALQDFGARDPDHCRHSIPNYSHN